MRESQVGSGPLTSVGQGLILGTSPSLYTPYRESVWESGDAWVDMNAALYI